MGRCIGCGVEHNAKDDWLRVDSEALAGVCSQCGEFVQAWDAGIRVRRFRPVDGEASTLFISKWCGSCQHDEWLRVPDAVGGCETGRCQLLDRAITLDVSDVCYPVEWTYGPLGYPVCLAYVPHDDQSLREAA